MTLVNVIKPADYFCLLSNVALLKGKKKCYKVHQAYSFYGTIKLSAVILTKTYHPFMKNTFEEYKYRIYFFILIQRIHVKNFSFVFSFDWPWHLVLTFLWKLRIPRISGIHRKNKIRVKIFFVDETYLPSSSQMSKKTFTITNRYGTCLLCVCTERNLSSYFIIWFCP